MQNPHNANREPVAGVVAFLRQHDVEPPAWQAQRVDDLVGLLDELRLGEEVKIAAALHAIAGDWEGLAALIEARFGADTARLYSDLVKVAGMDDVITQPVGETRKSGGGAEARQMLLLSVVEDLRVVFILLADRLALMRGIKQEPREVQIARATETQTIYAPLANRLGIGRIKWELEDLAFRYLEPELYKDIAGKLEARRVDREQFIAAAVAQLKGALAAADIPAEVYGRPKHIYSIWRKMQHKDKAFHELYDVRALRVMAEDVEACYAALGVVHALWQYIPGEYDDYIAAPKANMYQSLHTAVIGPGDQTLEVQIRTRDMHQHAELGVAAHWRYKEGGKRDPGLERRIERIRQLLSGEEGAVATVAAQGEDTIYVLTPKGNVVELPRSATPLDFAYRVHTEVGHRCRGAKVNGKMVPLTTALESGQEVEVITAREAAPSRDWLIPHLGYLKTGAARAKVRQWFKKQFRDEDITTGKTLLSRELTRAGIDKWDLEPIARRFNFNNADDLYAAVGRGEVGPHQAVNAWKEAHPVEEEPEPPALKHTAPVQGRGDIVVLGVGDLMTNMARCCQPVPGDDIVGYITRGRGITVHRRDCTNLRRLVKENPDRVVEVSWGHLADSRYEVDIEIDALDRSGLLRDVTSVLSAENINVFRANTHTNKKTQEARMRLSVEVHGHQQLQRALQKLNQIRNVMAAHRVK